MEKEAPRWQWAQTCSWCLKLGTQCAPTSLPRKDEVPREGLLQNPVGAKGCDRGALFGFCKCLDQTFLSWGTKDGQGQLVLLVEGTCCCFEQVQSIVCEWWAAKFLHAYCCSGRRTTQGIRFRLLSEFGMFFLKKKREVWDNFLFSESGTKIICRF